MILLEEEKLYEAQNRSYKKENIFRKLLKWTNVDSYVSIVMSLAGTI